MSDTISRRTGGVRTVRVRHDWHPARWPIPAGAEEGTLMQCTTGPAALFACICVGVLFVVSTAQAQPTCTWTDNPIVAGQTPIKAQHINEIRACLDAVIANWPDSPEPPPPPPPPPSGFNAGTWRVGVDVQPGRYFTSPPASCEWARAGCYWCSYRYGLRGQTLFFRPCCKRSRISRRRTTRSRQPASRGNRHQPPACRPARLSLARGWPVNR